MNAESTGRWVIVFAGALYDAPLWTNRQHVASRLAERGWNVLYVEPRLFLFRQVLGSFGGLRGRWFWLRRHFVPWQAADRLWVVAQSNLLPGSRRTSWVSVFNHRVWNTWRVRRTLRKLKVHEPTLLIYDTEAVTFFTDFPNAAVVYDCVDDHRVQAGVSRYGDTVAREEDQIALRASAIAATTTPLFEKFSATHPNVHLIPNSTDVGAFLTSVAVEPYDLRNIPHPRLGMVGALDAYKIDVPLVAEIARRRPDWHLVMVGPVEYVDRVQGAEFRVQGSEQVVMHTLRELPNVHFLGVKARDEIPAYAQAFDVALIPYRESAYNRASFPLKFWEFMAAGVPVVASGLPALEPYRHLASLARTPEEFISGVEQALLRGREGREDRQAEARRHDWSVRVAAIEQLLLQAAGKGRSPARAA